MRIGIDVSPLKSGHKVRGVGSYVSIIRDNIEKYDTNEYVFFEEEPPPNLDVVHYPYFDPFFKMPNMNIEAKKVVTIHDLIPIAFTDKFPSGIRARIRWELNKLKIKKADVVVVDSKASKDDVIKYTGVNPQNIVVSYLAASSIYKKVESRTTQYNLPKKYFLYVGDATWNKNIPRLIEAIQQTNSILVMVGKVWEKNLDEVSKNEWNNDLRKVLLQIRDNNHFINLGFVPDDELVGIYNNATALIMPSIAEGFGLPVLEAMNCGCPVITSNTSSLVEVGGDAVCYVNPLSVDSIVEAITSMSDEKFRDQLSKKGHSRAKEFSIEKMMKDLVSVYQGI